ncbi:hypothetical protein TNCV_1089461 [Trichonephila clavipes]|uniref:Uncharacterized protein n=1 Tax=Trichonephila clavipes TaxID=2585209 RepID=A0A8X6SSY7_TRICX|nr:hypothetical protein TNCV_1089461 [Trichonephila clavipes]
MWIENTVHIHLCTPKYCGVFSSDITPRVVDQKKNATPLAGRKLRLKFGGRGSRVVLVSERGLLCHEFEPSTTKDPPCRAAMHVKSVES